MVANLLMTSYDSLWQVLPQRCGTMRPWHLTKEFFGVGSHSFGVGSNWWVFRNGNSRQENEGGCWMGLIAAGSLGLAMAYAIADQIKENAPSPLLLGTLAVLIYDIQAPEAGFTRSC